ncbi:hypothetical protein [Kitasatospora sp. NPDC094015]|uniref:hypothetical protein n=1 Tax=Kitasatospora sp. NPDC094015 TaxID=3155205 RepID=UPI00333466FB
MNDTVDLPVLPASRDDCQDRLALIFPRESTGRPDAASPAAAAIVFAALYVGSVSHSRPFSLALVAGMSDPVASHRGVRERRAYYDAALSASPDKKIGQICMAAGFDRGSAWYKPNSRETLRTGALQALRSLGAILVADAPTNSARPRYYLDPDFAALFDSAIKDGPLQSLIEHWLAQTAIPLQRVAHHAERPAVGSTFGLADAYRAVVSGRLGDLIGQRECRWLDAKKEGYKLGNPAADAELCKDIAAFANLGGGLVLVGFETRMEGQTEVLASVAPLAAGAVDLARYRKLVRQWVVPHVRGLEIDWVSTSTDFGVISIYVPQQMDSDKLFSVSSRKSPNAIRVPIRDDDGTHWLSASELQRLISLGWNASA